MKRELEEELGISGASPEFIGFMRSKRDEVSEVHVGYVHILSVSSSEVIGSDEIGEYTYLNEEELIEALSEYEVWSQILIENYL